jgi:hypothetical protein
MDEDGYGWPLPGVANDDGQIQYPQGTARMPQNAADADVPVISCQGLNDFYAGIYQSYSYQTNDLRRLINRVQWLEAQHGMVTTVQDDTLAEVEIWGGCLDTSFEITARLGGGGNGGGGGSFLKSHLKQHSPLFFTGDPKLETVNLFLCKVEHWVWQGRAAMGTTESDMSIDCAWRFMDSEVFNWFSHCIPQQGVTVNPPADGSYVPVTWLLFESAFHHQSALEVAITAARKVIRSLRYFRGVGEVAHFNKCFCEMSRMLQ